MDEGEGIVCGGTISQQERDGGKGGRERGKRNCVRLCDLTKRERVTKMNSSFDKWVGEVCFDTWFMNNETSSLIFEL